MQAYTEICLISVKIRTICVIIWKVTVSSPMEKNKTNPQFWQMELQQP